VVPLLGWRIARQLVLAHPTAAILAALDDSVDAGHTAIESFTVGTRETSWQNLNGRIVETPNEARQAEPGPSVLLVFAISTIVAIGVLTCVWIVFLRT
jgi:hypothetical protein